MVEVADAECELIPSSYELNTFLHFSSFCYNDETQLE